MKGNNAVDLVQQKKDYLKKEFRYIEGYQEEKDQGLPNYSYPSEEEQGPQGSNIINQQVQQKRHSFNPNANIYQEYWNDTQRQHEQNNQQQYIQTSQKLHNMAYIKNIEQHIGRYGSKNENNMNNSKTQNTFQEQVQQKRKKDNCECNLI